VSLVGQHYGMGTLPSEPGAHGFQPPFYMLWEAVTRKYDGRVWEPDERINRVWAMKMWTRWPASYVRKPDELGSLENGKLADITVWDRDYFTIPEDDILKIRPLMTIVGGKVRSLNESLAKELGVPDVGPQFHFDDAQLSWIGKPVTEDGKKEAARH
jgi:hypothetical protein